MRGVLNTKAAQELKLTQQNKIKSPQKSKLETKCGVKCGLNVKVEAVQFEAVYLSTYN